MKGDIVKDILVRVLEIAARGDGAFTESMAREIESQVRHEYGGTECYINKRPALDDRREKARVALDRGVPVKDVARSSGMSRATLYNLLKGK